MSEFRALRADELSQVDGGFLPLVVVGVALLAGGCLSDLDEPGEVLPGFDDFLANTKRISGRQ